MGKTSKAAGIAAAIAIVSFVATATTIIRNGAEAPLAMPLAILTGIAWVATFILVIVGTILDRKQVTDVYPADQRDATVPEGVPTDWKRFLPFTNGRIGRADYIFANAAAGSAYLIACLLAGFGLGNISEVTGFEITESAAVTTAGIIFVPVAIGMIGWGAKRCHDIGKNGWWQILLLIPIVSIYATILLIGRPSQPKGNRFGPVPARSVGGWWALGAFVSYIVTYVLTS